VNTISTWKNQSQHQISSITHSTSLMSQSLPNSIFLLKLIIQDQFRGFYEHVGESNNNTEFFQPSIQRYLHHRHCQQHFGWRFFKIIIMNLKIFQCDLGQCTPKVREEPIDNKLYVIKRLRTKWTDYHF
jgi:hypothetical protein